MCRHAARRSRAPDSDQCVIKIGCGTFALDEERDQSGSQRGCKQKARQKERLNTVFTSSSPSRPSSWPPPPPWRGSSIGSSPQHATTPQWRVRLAAVVRAAQPATCVCRAFVARASYSLWRARVDGVVALVRSAGARATDRHVAQHAQCAAATLTPCVVAVLPAPVPCRTSRKKLCVLHHGRNVQRA